MKMRRLRCPLRPVPFNMKARSQRRDRLAQLIRKHGDSVEKDHLLGIFMLNNHVSLSTTYQYLQELMMAKVVIENDGHILAMEHYIRDNAENAKRLKELAET